MTDRVDAPMHGLEPPAPQAKLDRTSPDAQVVRQLRASDDAVLTFGQGRDAGVETSFTFCIDVMHNVRLDSHTAMVAIHA